MHANPRPCAYVLGLVALICSGQALACYELTETDANISERQLLRNFAQVFKCKGVSGLLLVPYIWSPISVNVDCGKLQTFQVYVGPDPDALIRRYQDREQAWCSLSSLFRPGCQLQISPFTTTYIGVRKIISTGVPCRFNHESGLSGWMLGSCLAGVLVFGLAGPLSESMALRVTSGGLLFALGSVIILIYVMARQMPGRRSMATTAMVLGSSSWALLRWLTGYWLPSAYALLHNRWLLAYLTASGLLGAAVTYLYGGVENTKLNTLMRVGLQLLGLLLLYNGTWTHASVFATLVGLALAVRVARPITAIASGLHRRHGAYKPSDVQPAEAEAAVSGERAPVTPLAASLRMAQVQQNSSGAAQPVYGGASPLPFTPLSYQSTAALGQAAAVTEYVENVSPLVRTGWIINPLNGRPMKVNSDPYTQLVQQGYKPNRVTGRMDPPPVTPDYNSSPEGAGQGRK